MAFLILVARILFSAIFIMSGISHFTQIQGMGQYAGSQGVPAPKFFVGLSGLMILLGGLSVLLGLWVKVGTLLLIAFLLPAAFIMHNFWAVDDPNMRATQQAHFMKNLALAGAAFLIFYFGTGPWSIM